MAANYSHSRLHSSLLTLPSRDGRVYFFKSWIWAFCMTFFGQRNFKKSDASRGLKTDCALGLPFSHCWEPFCHHSPNQDQPPPRRKHMRQKTRGPEEAPTLSVLPTTRHVSELSCCSLFGLLQWNTRDWVAVETRDIYFLHSWRLRSLRSRCWQIQWQWQSGESLVHSHLLAMSSHSQWKEQGSSLVVLWCCDL